LQLRACGPGIGPSKMTGAIVPFRIERFRPHVGDKSVSDLALFTPLLDARKVDA